ncbi:MAG TPA: fluoride efflux transporter CrcB [Lachnospiraceae bacterium]
MEVKILINCLIVGFGGAIGSIFRYLLSLVFVTGKTVFPIGTFIANILGAFIIGISVGVLSKFIKMDSAYGLFLRVGLCGGFTTFSTFALENVSLMQNGKIVLAATYIVLSLLLCLFAVWFGQKVVVYL